MQKIIQAIYGRSIQEKKMKFHKFLKYIFLYFVLLMPLYLHAEEKDTSGIAFFPMIGYSPDTNLQLGVSCVLYRNSDPENSDQKLDEVKIIASYSLKEQYSLSTKFTKYISGNDYLIEGKVGIARVPSEFYGIGADTPESNQEEYTPFYIPFRAAFMFNSLGRNFYIGPVYDAKYYTIEKREDDSLFEGETINGRDPMYSSGFGINLLYNSRDSGLYPRDGTYFEMKYLVYSHPFGSDSSFKTFSADFRHYFPLFSRAVFGIQIIGEKITGDAPFYYLPSLGGDEIMRGYGGGRYIARNCIASQAEVRFPIFWRIGGAFFASAGEVSTDITDFGTNIRKAGGVGLRGTLNNNRTINLRLDLAVNDKKEKSLYLKLLEAF
jgi:hypothetical protein